MTLTKHGTSRRRFLRGTAIAAVGVVGLPALQGLSLLPGSGRAEAANGNGGYGPLSPKPDLRDSVERIALPDGFLYRSFGVAGAPMSDGNPTPLAHDGMAAFPLANGNIRLIRNHEDRNGPGAGSVLGDPAKKYDPLGGGGTTSLEVHPVTRMLINDFVSINGTIVNCAGGLTPWESWLTCEESVAGPAQGWGKPHGYVFDVPVLAGGPVSAIPLSALGRFVHEAVAIDPATGIVYETEDSGTTSGFYRFVPDVPGHLGSGKLQMLAVKGKPNYNTTQGQRVNKPLPVEWFDINDPDPPVVTSETIFNQGYAAGGANFARLEGVWYGNGAIYFNSTSGGDAGLGQVWEYRPLGKSGGQLMLIFESPSAAIMESPDNICVSPRGGLVLCEDGDGDQYVWGLTPSGTIFDFALNLQGTREWAGACFSPDGQTLFVNRQGGTSFPLAAGDEGITFAIWGPWQDGAL